MQTIILLFAAAVLLRLISLVKSKANEKQLRKAQAVEYGKKNTTVLMLLHTAYYISCITEAILANKTANTITYIGIALLAFSMIMLGLVVYSLGAMWTVKLLIAPQQQVNTNVLFKYIRHPNYFLNILPELVAVALICQAWYTLMIGLPLYLIPLTIRIVQEEKVMEQHFSNY